MDLQSIITVGIVVVGAVVLRKVFKLAKGAVGIVVFVGLSYALCRYFGLI